MRPPPILQISVNVIRTDHPRTTTPPAPPSKHSKKAQQKSTAPAQPPASAPQAARTISQNLRPPITQRPCAPGQPTKHQAANLAPRQAQYPTKLCPQPRSTLSGLKQDPQRPYRTSTRPHRAPNQDLPIICSPQRRNSPRPDRSCEVQAPRLAQRRLCSQDKPTPAAP